MNWNDNLLKVSIFCGAALAVVAASDAVDSRLRVGAGALAAGFGAMVALLRPPTMMPPPEPPKGGRG